jgi:non-specific serine/threonine protein kinase
MHVGELLKRYRLMAGLTQEALAERAGVSARSIQAIERAESSPHRDTLQRLIAALDLQREVRTAVLKAALPTPRGYLAGRAAATHPPTGIDALQDPGAQRTNLPLQLTSFVGRKQEMVEVMQLLEQTRLLTLTGSGGTGKTRLVLQVAGGLREGYAQGVWLVDLAPLAEPTLVPQAVAAVLGVQGGTSRPLLATLVEVLRSRHILLLLDNCEHLVDACATLVEALLRACPRVHILATSREALGIAGEICWRVPSLSLPEADRQVALQELARYEAVQLFVERARAVQPQFALTERNSSAVAQICQQLDGIPLALELAAARMRGLTVEQLAVRLDQRFQLLTGGSRTALPRHQTLRATVDWSYGLLRPAEQQLFDRLSVFAGGFTLEAAEAVCADGEIARDQVLDLLLRLVDKSLVLADGEVGGVTWYRLLETLRQYGHELLRENVNILQERHAAFYLLLTEQANVGMDGQEEVTWRERLTCELDNLRAALTWCLSDAEGSIAASPGMAEMALRLASLDWFWLMSAHRREGLRWLEQALARSRQAPAAARAQALRIAALLAWTADDWTRGQALAEESVVLWREAGDRTGLSAALALLGGFLRVEWWGEAWNPETYARGTMLLEEALALAREVGGTALMWCLMGLAATANAQDEAELARAQAAAEECLLLCRQHGGPGWIGQAHRTLGWLALQTGDYARARTESTAALAQFWAAGEMPAVAVVLIDLGDASRGGHAFAEATAFYEQSFDLNREFDFHRGHVARLLCRFGDLALDQDDLIQARRRYAESLRIAHAAAAPGRIAAALEGLGNLAVLQGQPERALRLVGAAAACRERSRQPLRSRDQSTLEAKLDPARAALSAALQTAAWMEGQTMATDSALQYALGADPSLWRPEPDNHIP